MEISQHSGNASPFGHGTALPLKVLLYSHDSFGLGHFRRNLAIARAMVSQSPDATVLILSGSPCATHFQLPERCDVVKLPSVGKDENGCYVPRSLGVDLDRALDLRQRLILAAYESFVPDVVIVDHQLTGLRGEAMPMVRAARRSGKLTLFGMREIVDSADVVERDWGTPECLDALENEYRHILVYGDRGVFDTVDEYPVLQRFRHKISTVGYISNPVSLHSPRPVPTLEKHVLVTVGGGQDGGKQIETYLEALNLSRPSWTTHIVTGPLMDKEQVRACKVLADRWRLSNSIRISRFHDNVPRLIQQADAVVSMAGYNSCAEILRSKKPTVLLPRNQMRHEQRIRARRLSQKGLAQSLDELDAVALRDALERALSAPPTAVLSPDLNGLDNLCRLVGNLSETPAGSHAVQ